MSQTTNVHMTATVAFDGDGTGAGSQGARIRLSVEGAVAVSAMEYEWAGVATADEVQDVAFLAKWAFGRALAAATRRPATGVSGEGGANGWKTVVTWSSNALPTVTVTLDGFTSLADARVEAKQVVDDLVKTLVPPNNPIDRRSRLNMVYLPGRQEDWAEHLYRESAQYP